MTQTSKLASRIIDISRLKGIFPDLKKYHDYVLAPLFELLLTTFLDRCKDAIPSITDGRRVSMDHRKYIFVYKGKFVDVFTPLTYFQSTDKRFISIESREEETLRGFENAFIAFSKTQNLYEMRDEILQTQGAHLPSSVKNFYEAGVYEQQLPSMNGGLMPDVVILFSLLEYNAHIPHDLSVLRETLYACQANHSFLRVFGFSLDIDEKVISPIFDHAFRKLVVESLLCEGTTTAGAPIYYKNPMRQDRVPRNHFWEKHHHAFSSIAETLERAVGYRLQPQQTDSKRIL